MARAPRPTAIFGQPVWWPYVRRTLVPESTTDGRVSAMAVTDNRTRSARLEVRMTPEDRKLIDEAVAACGTGLTDFVVSKLRLAAHEALADRTVFVLDAEAQRVWEEMNERPARDLPGLRGLMSRPSPFVDG